MTSNRDQPPAPEPGNGEAGGEAQQGLAVSPELRASLTRAQRAAARAARRRAAEPSERREHVVAERHPAARQMAPPEEKVKIAPGVDPRHNPTQPSLRKLALEGAELPEGLGRARQRAAAEQEPAEQEPAAGGQEPKSRPLTGRSWVWIAGLGILVLIFLAMYFAGKRNRIGQEPAAERSAGQPPASSGGAIATAGRVDPPPGAAAPAVTAPPSTEASSAAADTGSTDSTSASADSSATATATATIPTAWTKPRPTTGPKAPAAGSTAKPELIEHPLTY